MTIINTHDLIKVTLNISDPAKGGGPRSSCWSGSDDSIRMTRAVSELKLLMRNAMDDERCMGIGPTSVFEVKITTHETREVYAAEAASDYLKGVGEELNEAAFRHAVPPLPPEYTFGVAGV